MSNTISTIQTAVTLIRYCGIFFSVSRYLPLLSISIYSDDVKAFNSFGLASLSPYIYTYLYFPISSESFILIFYSI